MYPGAHPAGQLAGEAAAAVRKLESVLAHDREATHAYTHTAHVNTLLYCSLTLSHSLPPYLPAGHHLQNQNHKLVLYLF